MSDRGPPCETAGQGERQTRRGGGLQVGVRWPIMALLEPAGGAAMMPDLQHKLSKKVAQLTKVIYHLNSKQEEHALDISELADQYETEIETILRDAADRLNWFKNQLDTKVLEGNNAQLAQELQAPLDPPTPYPSPSAAAAAMAKNRKKKMKLWAWMVPFSV